jgi:signal transduction histidine kinase
MIKTLKIETFSQDLWNKFINDNRYSDNVSTLIIDYKNCNFLEPSNVVQLACLIEEYYQNHTKIIFLEGGDQNFPLQEYLTNIRLLEYWNDGFDRTTYTQNSKITNLCLWRLDSTMVSPYVVHAQRYFESNFQSDISFEPLNIALSELFNNIIDHSNSKISGYTTSQYYPKIGKLKIAVCDFGNGIPNRVNSYLNACGKPVLKDSDALKKAFEYSFSTKSAPHNRGFGLDTLSEIVKTSNGELRVVSNNGMCIMKPHETQFYDIKHSFNGTHFEIILDTTTFYPKDEENFEDDFSF